MTVLNRLKLELGNQEYYTDEEYTQLLIENSLVATDDYNKSTMQRNLLLTVLDVLTTVSNDVDKMRSVSTEFENLGSAYKFLEQRIDKLREQIANVPTAEDDNSSNVFSLMFTE